MHKFSIPSAIVSDVFI